MLIFDRLAGVEAVRSAVGQEPHRDPVGGRAKLGAAARKADGVEPPRFAVSDGPSPLWSLLAIAVGRCGSGIRFSREFNVEAIHPV